jgi:DNA modification methylase
MGGERAILMATDPPYLVDYDGGNHPQTWRPDGRPVTSEDKTKHWDAYVDHDNSIALYSGFLAAALAKALTEAPVIYQWFSSMRVEVVFEAWRANGLLPHQILIWQKNRPVLGRTDFMYDFEPMMYGWVQGKRPEPERRPPANTRTVWSVDQKEGVEEDLGSVHLTIKPVELIRRCIDYHTRPGELIYEPFSGSGTAIVAAQVTGRRCYAIELSPAFCDVAVARWEALTGEKAEVEHGEDE